MIEDSRAFSRAEASEYLGHAGRRRSVSDKAMPLPVSEDESTHRHEQCADVFSLRISLLVKLRNLEIEMRARMKIMIKVFLKSSNGKTEERMVQSEQGCIT